jgi:hypothetical protein
MSSGHYCVIRDLGLVKGGKGLRHHEVVVHLSCRGLFVFVTTVLLEHRAKWIPVRLKKLRQAKSQGSVLIPSEPEKL